MSAGHGHGSARRITYAEATQRTLWAWVPRRGPGLWIKSADEARASDEARYEADADRATDDAEAARFMGHDCIPPEDGARRGAETPRGVGDARFPKVET